MVKIIEKTLEERMKEDKFHKLIEIASRLPDVEVSKHSFVGYSYFAVAGGISVHSDHNLIEVAERESFDTAMRLAEAYELEIGEEFIVKKDY